MPSVVRVDRNVRFLLLSHTFIGAAAVHPGIDDVRVMGRYAYVSYYDDAVSQRIYILDVADPATPAVLGHYDPSDYWPFFEVNAANTLLAVGLNHSTSKKVLLVDVTTKASPTLAATITEADKVVALAIRGNYLYVVCVPAAAASYIHIWDITTPGTPSDAGTYTYSHSGNAEAHCLALHPMNANYLVNVEGGKYLDIIDVTTPASPTLAGEYTCGTTFSYAQVWAQGNRAVATSSTRLRLSVCDITTPATPAEVEFFVPMPGTLSVTSYAMAISPGGKWVFAVSGDGNAYIWNVEGTPYIDTTLPPGTTFLDCVFQRGLVFLAADKQGLMIYGVVQFGTPGPD